jgi:hypothetical protein
MRALQLWEYRVSHGPLLIRSPQVEYGEIGTNVDIVCTVAEFLSFHRFLRGLGILEARIDEMHNMDAILGKELSPISVRIIASMGKDFQLWPQASRSKRAAKKSLKIHSTEPKKAASCLFCRLKDAMKA